MKIESLVSAGQQAVKGFLIDTHRDYTSRRTIYTRREKKTPAGVLCTMHWIGVLQGGHGVQSFISVKMTLTLLPF